MEPLIIFFAGLFGLVFGSFANAFAYRLPRGESLMTRSHCTTCDNEISGWQNIPILSWLILRGRCWNCKERISPRYILVEAFTLVAFAVLAWRATELQTEVLPQVLTALAFCVFAFSGVALSLIDLDTKTLPTKIIYPTLLIVVALLSTTSILTGDFEQILRAAIAAAATSGIFFLLWWLKPGSMGFGDVRLVLLTGFILGWISIGVAVLGFFVPFFLGALYVIPLMIAKKAGGKTAVPLGPWIILGTMISITWGEALVATYLSLGGLV